MNLTQPYQDISTVYYALAAVLLPLFAFLVNVCLPGKTNKLSGWVSTVAILTSVVFAALVFAGIWNREPQHVQTLWFTIGDNNLYAGVLLNNLSALMLLLVSVVALPVHIYSIAYMGHDENYKRNFSYLSFFCFSMLALVVVDNMFLFYAFWELVGFSSYLLIGFWFTRAKAVQANKKAFIMNRVGDVGLLVAIIILFTYCHTADIAQLFGDNAAVKEVQIPALWQTIACIGIFMGVAAKSAQFPLHTWLPDAMEGPTSVSALIHAATMVATGVFLLGRVYPMFNSAELDVLAIIGCFTAFMAATIALTQNDLKRVLAYSTISQLGFMIMAMGIGAYASSLFHLATHAFFKCLLFLVAGIVIHQMQHVKDEHKLDIDPQDIRHMGGLRKTLPLTFIAAVIASLALIGIPLTSGYLSKDGILVQAFEWSDGKSWAYRLVPIFALIAGLLTAFYIARLIVKVFFGEFRLLKHHPNIKLHLGDGEWQYRLPLILLTICCFFPLFSINPVIYEQSWIIGGLKQTIIFDRLDIYHTIIPVGATIVNIFVMYFAYNMYVKRKTFAFPQTGFLYKLSYHEWYIDKFYDAAIVKPVLALSKTSSWFDKNVIDGFINLLKNVVLMLSKIAAFTDKYIIDGLLHLLTAIVQQIGNFARNFQSGKIQYYLFSMLVIVLALFIYFLW